MDYDSVFVELDDLSFQESPSKKILHFRTYVNVFSKYLNTKTTFCTFYFPEICVV
jgi:hypothetical protein